MTDEKAIQFQRVQYYGLLQEKERIQKELQQLEWKLSEVQSELIRVDNNINHLKLENNSRWNTQRN